MNVELTYRTRQTGLIQCHAWGVSPQLSEKVRVRHYWLHVQRMSGAITVADELSKVIGRLGAKKDDEGQWPLPATAVEIIPLEEKRGRI